MRAAVLRAMVIGLIRDPAAFVLSFVLPAAVFAIFALIFAGASGGSLAIKLAVLDQEQSSASQRFLKGVGEHPQIEVIEPREAQTEAVTALVRSGAADVGVVVRGGKRTLESASLDGAPPILLITDPTREIAVAVVEGVLQEAYFSQLPDVVVRGVAQIVANDLLELDPAQQIRLDAGLEALTQATEERARNDSVKENGARQETPLPFYRLVERQSGIGDPSVPTSIAYYAGAVAIMFLLYSALTSSMSLLQERDSGLLERLSTGPAGVRPVIDGKFFYLVIQGVIQVGIIFLVAWLGFGLGLPNHFPMWFAVTFAAAISAAGLTLAFVSLCRTLHQANTLGTILVLVVSAIGGSMLPRFLMPPSIQSLGWMTPNTWAIEAYAAIFWRNESWPEIGLPVAVLTISGLAGLLVAHIALVRRR